MGSAAARVGSLRSFEASKLHNSHYKGYEQIKQAKLLEPFASQNCIVGLRPGAKSDMPMITVISGTNRFNSQTLQIARHFTAQLKEMGMEAQLLDLAKVDMSHYVEEMYDPKAMAPALVALQTKYILDVKKIVFVVPEYNGSFPGVVKLFIDGISINEYPKNLGGSHIALIGVSSGRAGNLRGLDHLTSIVNHMGGSVIPNKLPLSNVNALLNDAGELDHEPTDQALKKLAAQLIAA
jgi:NAD(P)H-dependent FMN reductase